ncbi:hypothetical protein C8Q73DRAFT_664434 [Cubamyces lactineus]|nr:hypothetical protein C8Q73DRAFT_664434 [Cubamyces lactineus]
MDVDIRTPEAVTQALIRPTIYGCIFAHCTPQTLVLFSRTSRTARSAVQDYMGRAFNVNKRLSRYFSDPLAFRSLQARTATVISGSFALQFFDRMFYPELDLDLYVHSNDLVLDVGLYLQSEGYVYQPDSWDLENWPSEIHRLCGRLQENDVEIDNDTNPYALRYTRAVYTFIRGPADDAQDETCVMNVIAYNAAYSLFPLPTLEYYESLVLNASNVSGRKALEKYSRRGWRTIANSPPLVPFLETHGFHFDTPRWVCDGRTWTIPLSTEGAASPPRASPLSDALSWDPIAESGWTLKRGKYDWAVLGFGTVSTKVLRWGYTTANDDYLRLLKIFFVKQGRMEHSKLPVGRTMEDSLDIWTW